CRTPTAWSPEGDEYDRPRQTSTADQAASGEKVPRHGYKTGRKPSGQSMPSVSPWLVAGWDCRTKAPQSQGEEVTPVSGIRRCPAPSTQASTLVSAIAAA